MLFLEISLKACVNQLCLDLNYLPKYEKDK